ncbi:hypothetical protein ACRS6B_00180 [Nocardia asteroides]
MPGPGCLVSRVCLGLVSRVCLGRVSRVGPRWDRRSRAPKGRLVSRVSRGRRASPVR